MFFWLFSTVKNSGRVLLYLPVFFVTHGVYGTDIFALMIYYFFQRAATHMFKNLSVLQQLVVYCSSHNHSSVKNGCIPGSSGYVKICKNSAF